MTIDDYSAVYTEHHKTADMLAARLADAGDEARAKRLRECATYTTGFVCPDCGEFQVFNTRLCRDRLCPNCSWVLARKRSLAVMQALETLRDMTNSLEVYHLVLTIQHERWSDLRGMLLTLTRCYGFLMRSDLFNTMYGSVRSIEITYHDAHGFHPHIHALVAAPKGALRIGVDDVRDAWAALLAEHYAFQQYDPQVEFRAAYDRSGVEDTTEAVFEACKYAIKPQAYEEMDDAALLYFSAAIKGIRMTSADGVLRLLLKEQREGTRKHKDECSACASKSKQHHRALYWDYERAELCEGRPL